MPLSSDFGIYCDLECVIIDASWEAAWKTVNGDNAQILPHSYEGENGIQV